MSNADLAALAGVVEYLLVLLRGRKTLLPEEYKELMDTIDRIKERETEPCND